MSVGKYDAVMAGSVVSPSAVPLVAYDATTDVTLDIRGYKEKALLVKNTGANTLTYTVLGSLDDGASYDLVIVGDTAVLTAAQSLYRDSAYCTHWKVRVKAAAATTFVTKLAAIGA